MNSLRFPWVFAPYLSMAAGCDPGYTLHLDVSVASTDSQGGGVDGARVVRLGDASGTQWFVTGRDGRGSGAFGGFLDSPEQSAIGVYKKGFRLAVALPNRDFALRERSWFFATEWDADLALALAPLSDEPGLAAACDVRGTCRIVYPAGYRDWCTPRVLTVSDERAIVTGIVTRPVVAVGQGAQRLSFELPPVSDAAEQFLVLSCHSPAVQRAQPSWAIVSDALRRGLVGEVHGTLPAARHP